LFACCSFCSIVPVFEKQDFWVINDDNDDEEHQLCREFMNEYLQTQGEHSKINKSRGGSIASKNATSAFPITEH
jgi:hypothetical protein